MALYPKNGILSEAGFVFGRKCPNRGFAAVVVRMHEAKDERPFANHTAILSYSAAAAGTLEGVTWHATGINNGKEAVVSVEAGTDPTLVYEKAGTITGNATCNSFNGPAVVDGSNVKVGPLNSTRMACADEAKNAQEAAYLAALENATTFEVRAGHLELRDAQGALQVSFETR